MTLQLSSGVRQSLLYGLSIALMKGVSLLILPFIAAQLSHSEFGRLEVISSLAIIGSILVGMGMEDTLFRFVGQAKNQSQRVRIAAQIFTLTQLIAVVALVCGWFAAPTISAWIPGSPSVYEVRLVLAVLALEGCISVPLGWLRMNNRALPFFLASCGRALTQAVLVVIFLFLQRGVAGILEAGLIAAIAQTALLCYLQIRDTGLAFDLKSGQRALIYSVPIVASGLVAFALNGLDRWVLADHSSLADVAEFGIAAKFALAMVLLLQPFGMWWSPRRFTVLNERDGAQKVARFSAMGGALAILIATLVALLCPVLINALLPASYTQAGQYALGLVLVMLLKELVELFNIGCFTGKTTSSQFIINLFSALVGITGMLLLTPEYQVWGIILSLLIAQSLRLLLFYQVSQYFLALNYPIRDLLKLATLAIFWIALGTQITHLGQLSLVVISAAITLLATAHYLQLLTLPFTFRQKRLCQ
ncbi:MAG: O-antigen/teichoic acid export membrane protein [Psychromonas sp.]|jgi:O-antigen/teichoic acid export membrane protein|uniref:lipopolysaccharide biosynthesis protein n=1 Tax=Psychromonas sp. TaxID=1884585 RepID=UPI0039E6F44D